MDRRELERRTRQFHIEVLHLCNELPRTPAGFEMSKQLARAAGSVGANYRATKRAKSKLDFIHKIEIVLEEADECHSWLGIVYDSGMLQNDSVIRLTREADELTAIFARTDQTAKANYRASK